MTFDVKAAIAAAKAALPNQTEATKGGSFDPPAAGLARLRLVGYIETGKKVGEYQGQPKTEYGVRLVFELSGKKHEPRKLDDGSLIPHRITVFSRGGTNYGALNAKATLFKLFAKLNYDGSATHFAELLGKEFLGEVEHYDRKDGSKGFGLSLESLRKPYVEQLNEDGEIEAKRIEAGPMLSPLRLFLWNFPSKEMWDSLYISGEYEDGKSKNVLQEAIMSADNWHGSPMQQLLEAGDDGLPYGDAESPPKASAVSDDDALNGIV